MFFLFAVSLGWGDAEAFAEPRFELSTWPDEAFLLYSSGPKDDPEALRFELSASLLGRVMNEAEGDYIGSAGELEGEARLGWWRSTRTHIEAYSRLGLPLLHGETVEVEAGTETLPLRGDHRLRAQYGNEGSLGGVVTLDARFVHEGYGPGFFRPVHVANSPYQRLRFEVEGGFFFAVNEIADIVVLPVTYRLSFLNYTDPLAVVESDLANGFEVALLSAAVRQRYGAGAFRALVFGVGEEQVEGGLSAGYGWYDLHILNADITIKNEGEVDYSALFFVGWRWVTGLLEESEPHVLVGLGFSGEGENWGGGFRVKGGLDHSPDASRIVTVGRVDGFVKVHPWPWPASLNVEATLETPEDFINGYNLPAIVAEDDESYVGNRPVLESYIRAAIRPSFDIELPSDLELQLYYLAVYAPTADRNIWHPWALPSRWTQESGFSLAWRQEML